MRQAAAGPKGINRSIASAMGPGTRRGRRAERRCWGWHRRVRAAVLGVPLPCAGGAACAGGRGGVQWVVEGGCAVGGWGVGRGKKLSPAENNLFYRQNAKPSKKHPVFSWFWLQIPVYWVYIRPGMAWSGQEWSGVVWRSGPRRNTPPPLLTTFVVLLSLTRLIKGSADFYSIILLLLYYNIIILYYDIIIS